MCKLLARCLSLFLVASAVASAAPAAMAPPEIERAWFRLTGALEPLDQSSFSDRTEELLRLAATFELRRLTPYAQALLLKARTLPATEQAFLLRQALRLDPWCPEVLFQLASLQLKQLQPAGLVTAARAFVAFLRDGRLVRFRQASLLLLALFVVGLVAAAWALATVGKTLPRLWHDLLELASTWRLGANAWVFALFLAGLPLFLTLDPLWLFFWLFALCWGYWGAAEKWVGLGTLLFCLGAPTLLEVASRSFTHPLDPLQRAALALQEGRYDPGALLDLEGLADLFANEPDFYRLKGDLERQFGLYDASLLSYQAGLRLKAQDPALLMGAGCVYFLQGNFGAAVQYLSQSRDGGYDPVVVNYNLSLAFAHVYNFRDSDEAMAAATRASQARLRKLTQGRDNQLILPAFTPKEAQALLARKDPVALLNRGLMLPPLARERTIFSPLTLAALVGLILALAHFLWRQRGRGFAKACSKCGRTFCSRCKLSRESQSYCTQCINIFLKRDMVAPELQIAKHRQLARRQAFLRWRRRLADTFLPGLGLVLSGRPWLGTVLLLLSALLSLATLLWLPRFVEPLLLHVDGRPLHWVLAAFWATLLVSAQLAKEGDS
jgi:tetratricopeptide (TPR) repeat protein